jgi:heterodisulfide reductase subunit A
MTNTHVLDVEGQAGDFTVSLRQEPRYVAVDRCIDCGRCADACPIERPTNINRA